jgi:aspartate/tyrosine/aromatic aminotransferase
MFNPEDEESMLLQKCWHLPTSLHGTKTQLNNITNLEINKNSSSLMDAKPLGYADHAALSGLVHSV